MSELQSVPKLASSLNLCVGEWVEVRSADEILATLDANNCVERLPFMPEMLQYCGKRFRVFASAHKTSDTIELFTIRRMSKTVHLAGLRCDGASHGGCQAGCLLFWKESWLKRVPSDRMAGQSGSKAAAPSAANHSGDEKYSSLFQATRQPVAPGEAERYKCQATEMLNATTNVRRRHRWDPRFYIRDLTSGNVTLFDFVRFGAFAMLNSFLLRWFNCRLPHIHGLAGERTPSCDLNLQTGDLVRVRTKKEIMLTLNRNQRNRGLWFDVELLPFCGKGNFRVLRRVEKIINEKSGKMIKMTNPCVILDGVTCSGNYSHERMFSRRHEYHFWHEIWLERADEGNKNAPASNAAARE